jgi:hypothetical protein
MITLKRLIVIFIVSSICIAGFSQDFGFTSDNEGVGVVDMDGSDISFLSRDYVWFDARSGNMIFDAQASYRFTLSEFYFFNVDHMYLSGSFPISGFENTLFKLTVGRFPIEDFSSYILNHTLDGLLVSYSNAASDLSAYIGYSGFLWDNLLSSIELSRGDNTDKSNPELHLQSPRLVGIFRITFPELFSAQSLDVSYIFQQDLRDSSTLVPENQTTYDGSKGGLLNTQYLGVGLKGAPASFFFYDVFYYFGTGTTLSYIGDPALSPNGIYQNKPILSALAGASLRFYFEQALFSRIELKGAYSTGDPDYYSYLEGNTSGYANLFIPISHSPVGIAFVPDLGNIFFAELDYSIKPFASMKISALEEFQMLFRGIAFFRSQVAPISVGGINQASSSLYLGTELDAIVNYRPMSDLGFKFVYACFIPDSFSPESAFLTDQVGISSVIKLEMSLSM